MPVRTRERALSAGVAELCPALPRALSSLLVLACAIVGAPEAQAQRLPFTHFSTDDGLAATQVWHAMQDRRGLLWISTTWGLNRYDGSSFSTFSIDDGLPSSNIRLSIEDREGHLWVGTNAGLARYDGSRVESFAARGGALAATVWSAGLDRHGVLWFGTNLGLVAAHDGEFRTFTQADGLASDYAYGLLLSRDGAVWVGSRGHGVTRCALERDGRLGHCRVFTSRDGLGADAVHAIAEGADGAIFFGTRGGGLSRFDGTRFHAITTADGLASDDLYALTVRRGELLVGTDRGMSLCALPAGAPCRTLNEANGLPDDGVRCFLEDREGALWVGAEGGLARLGREDVLSYGVGEGLPDAHVYALASDGDGGVWVGTFQGLAHLQIGPAGEPRARQWHEKDGLPAEWVWALLRDRRGALWIGGENGVARLRAGGEFEAWRKRDGLSDDYVVALLEDRRGAIWVAAIDGVSRIEPGEADGGSPRITGFTVEDGLAAPRAYALGEDREGRVWVAHGEALSYFDGDRFRALGPESGLRSPSTRSIGVDREGALWVGGQGQLARLLETAPGTPPRFAPLDAGGALDDYLILSIAENETGHLVLGTNRGVLTLSTAGRVAEVVERFDRTSGALASEVSHSSAFARDSLGRFWFGFKGGASIFLARGEPLAPVAPPRVVFERLSTPSGLEMRAPFSAAIPGISGGSATGDASRALDAAPVELPTSERTFRVEARALSLAGERALRFQFRLLGVEDEWSEARAENAREYVKLPPGSYRLQARARLAEGEWSAPAELRIALLPAWYETRTALLAGALAAGLAVFGAATLRTRRIAKRNRVLAGEVDARTDDLARYARALEENVHALDRANDRIRLADRHRGEFLAKMSHELRTPLTSVLGFAALLRDGLEGKVDPRHLRYLQNIHESGNHLLRLINNLLDQAKLEAGKMDLHLEPANVEVIVESALALVEGFAATRSVRLSLHRFGAVPPVTVDVAKLRQIVINLVSNAIKFSPPHGEVEISCRNVPNGETDPPAPPGPGEPSYEIVVADRGPGVAAGDQERIFEPFRQITARGETQPGTGLGLPIVRQFATLLGGRVAVSARDGGGSEFTVRLPVDAAHRPPAEARSGAGVWGGEATAERPRVLVLEPDRGRFSTLAAELDRRGFLAVRAPDAEEGARMVRELRPAVLAIDIDASSVEAWTALAGVDRERARRAVPTVLFAFASGTERGIAAGFHRCFVGPVASAELVAALAAAVESRPHRPPATGAPAAWSAVWPAVWIAALPPTASHGLDSELEARGYSAVRQPLRSRALAEASTGGFAAAILDLGDSTVGGFELAVAMQSVATPPLAWIGLAPPALPSSERRRLYELSEQAREPAGVAVAVAVERLLTPG